MLASFIALLAAFSRAIFVAEGLDSISVFQQETGTHSRKFPQIMDGDVNFPPRKTVANKPVNGQQWAQGSAYKVGTNRQYSEGGFNEPPKQGVWQLPTNADAEQYKVTQLQMENSNMDKSIQEKEEQVMQLLYEFTMVQKEKDDMFKNMTWYRQNKDNIPSMAKEKVKVQGMESAEAENRLMNVTKGLKIQLQLEGAEEFKLFDNLTNEVNQLAIRHSEMLQNVSAIEKKLAMFPQIRAKNEALQASLADHSPSKQNSENILANTQIMYDNVSSVANPLRHETEFISTEFMKLQTLNAQLTQSYTNVLDSIGELSAKVVDIRDPLISE